MGNDILFQERRSLSTDINWLRCSQICISDVLELQFNTLASSSKKNLTTRISTFGINMRSGTSKIFSSILLSLLAFTILGFDGNSAAEMRAKKVEQKSNSLRNMTEARGAGGSQDQESRLFGLLKSDKHKKQKGSYGTPKPQYGAPKPQYGAPKPQYVAPKPQYGAPKPQYEAPKAQYGAPKPNYKAPTHHSQHDSSYSQPAYSPSEYSPPSYSPPAYSPPSYSPPEYSPPSYSPPAYSPPSYSPPDYGHAEYSPPSYNRPSYSPPAYTEAPYSPPYAPSYEVPSYSPPAYPETPAYEHPAEYSPSHEAPSYSPPAYTEAPVYQPYDYSPAPAYGEAPYSPPSKPEHPTPYSGYPESHKGASEDFFKISSGFPKFDEMLKPNDFNFRQFRI